MSSYGYDQPRREPTFSGAVHKVSKEVTNFGKKLASDDTYRMVKDKAEAALAVDATGKAAIKATSHEHGPPKEKHVQALLSAVMDPTINFHELMAGLFMRLHDKDATVVLKAFMVFHRLFRDSPPQAKMYQRIIPNISEFRIAKFLDDSSHESMQASQMVRAYALYMEEKLCCFRTTKFEYDKPSDELTSRIHNMRISELMAHLKAIIPQLEAGYKCTIRDQNTIHPTSVAAFSLIFMDLRSLYQTLNKGVLCLLENYFSTPKEDARKILALYKEYISQTKKVSRIFNDAKDLLGQQPIELNTPPDSFQRSLEQYLEDDDEHPMHRPSKAEQEEEWKKVPVVPLEDLIGDFGDLSVEPVQPTKTGDKTLDDFFATIEEPPSKAKASPPTVQAQTVNQAKNSNGGGVDDLFGLLSSPLDSNPFADPNPFGGSAVGFGGSAPQGGAMGFGSSPQIGGPQGLGAMDALYPMRAEAQKKAQAQGGFGSGTQMGMGGTGMGQQSMGGTMMGGNLFDSPSMGMGGGMGGMGTMGGGMGGGMGGMGGGMGTMGGGMGGGMGTMGGGMGGGMGTMGGGMGGGMGTMGGGMGGGMGTMGGGMGGGMGTMGGGMGGGMGTMGGGMGTMGGGMGGGMGGMGSMGGMGGGMGGMGTMGMGGMGFGGSGMGGGMQGFGGMGGQQSMMGGGMGFGGGMQSQSMMNSSSDMMSFGGGGRPAATMSGKIGPAKIGPKPGAPAVVEPQENDGGLGELVSGMLYAKKQ